MSKAASVERVAAALATRLSEPPEVVLVLGSGLAALADGIEAETRVPYGEIEGLVPAGVEGHPGTLVSGRVRGLRVTALQGRVHLYEGHSAEQVVLGLRALIRLGARTVVLTNAAGGIRPDLDRGALMLIEDQLNLTGTNSLVGPHDAALGPRFPAMNDVYDPALRALCRKVAAERGVQLAAGVYAGLLGPSYETPAEVRMLRVLGADAVGMSTVLEAIAARQMGARCLGLSCITNRAAELASAPPDHAEVQTTARAALQRVQALVIGVLEELAAV